MKIRLCGDVHGDNQVINRWIQDHQFDLTIVLGDFGAGFGSEKMLNHADPDKFKVLFGNHDNYNILAEYPHNMGRFGQFEFGGINFFFVGGAWSIDYEFRTPGFDWWENEELSYKESNDCLDLWDEVKNDVDIVLSHDCPISVAHNILGFWPNQTHTSALLQEMYKIHQPKRWYFGHYHKGKTINHQDTVFRCLNINETVLIPPL